MNDKSVVGPLLLGAALTGNKKLSIGHLEHSASLRGPQTRLKGQCNEIFSPKSSSRAPEIISDFFRKFPKIFATQGGGALPVLTVNNTGGKFLAVVNDTGCTPFFNINIDGPYCVWQQ
jgi:hypothetical protein